MTQPTSSSSASAGGLGSLGVYIVLGIALYVTKDTIWAWIALGIFGFSMALVLIILLVVELPLGRRANRLKESIRYENS